MENCGNGNMNATYIYMPLKMDLFGRLIFWRSTREGVGFEI